MATSVIEGPGGTSIFTKSSERQRSAVTRFQDYDFNMQKKRKGHSRLTSTFNLPNLSQKRTKEIDEIVMCDKELSSELDKVSKKIKKKSKKK